MTANRSLRIGVLFLLLWSGTAVAQSPTRLALIIGNGAYRGAVPALENPAHDATAVAGMTQRLGFSTILLLDANLAEMQAAIRAFGRSAAGADTALIYYSGHGIEANGQNYLLPVDLALRPGDSPASLAPRSLSLNDINTALANNAATTLIFIDACRNDPFATTAAAARAATSKQPASPAYPAAHGMAAVPASEGGLAAQPLRNATVVLYATGPGTVALDGAGAYSPFTTALLQSFEASGSDLNDLFHSVQVTVSDATSGWQKPTPDRTPIPAIPLFRRANTGASAKIARVATAARGGTAGGSFLGLPVVIEPAPPYFPFYCSANPKRGWTSGSGGHGTLVVNRNGPACATQIFGSFDPLVPARGLTVAEPPRNGRIVIVDNSFAYVPNPGYTGPDRFVINAVATAQRDIPMHGEMQVTVR